MNVVVSFGPQRWRVHVEQPLDISVPPRAEDDDATASSPAHVWDTGTRAPSSPLPGAQHGGNERKSPPGGAVPGVHGTRTEGQGLLKVDGPGPGKVLQASWVPATVITLAPRFVLQPGQDFPSLVLTVGLFRDALATARPAFLRAIVVRTLPNDRSQLTSRWEHSNPPCIEPEAINFLKTLGVVHLLVDLPSVDPETDAQLPAHRALFGGEDGARHSLTERCFIDNRIADGSYILNLQLAPLTGEVTPARPVLYPVEPDTLNRGIATKVDRQP